MSYFSPIFSCFFLFFPIFRVQISYFPIFLSLCAGWHPEYNSGEQNKDMTKARQKRGMMDTLIILFSRLRLTGIVLLPTVTSEISRPVQRLTMLSVLIALELLERRYCLQCQERQLVITLLRGVSKLSLLLQSLLSGLKATTCRYIRNSCCSGLSLLTAAPMIWRAVSLWTRQLPNGSVWFYSDAAETAKTSSCRCPTGQAFTRCHINSRRRCSACIIDGGVLLHRISWPRRSATYQDVFVLYRNCG